MLPVAQACAVELGLTHVSAIQPGDPANVSYKPPGLDMTDMEVRSLTRFVTSLPAPIERPQAGHTYDDVFDGESVFNSIGCAVCHVPDVLPVTDLFSDLLLHDMGAELQAASAAPAVGAKLAGSLALQRYPKRGPFTGMGTDYSGGSTSEGVPMPEEIARPQHPQFPRGPRAEAAAADDQAGATWDDLQREWRTPPLWGVADSAPYLHDGRAETLEQAVLWHGGEAQQSRDLYAALKPSEKKQLLAFLSSLRAPTAAPDEKAP